MKNKDFINIETHYSLSQPNQSDSVFHKGEGVWLWDIESLQYLDLTTMQNHAIFGHSPSRLVKVLVEQAQNLSLNTNFVYTDRLGPFLKKLSEMTLFARCMAFSSTYQAYSEMIFYSMNAISRLKNLATDELKVVFLSSRHKDSHPYVDLFHGCSFLSLNEIDELEKVESQLSLVILDLLDLNQPNLLLTHDTVFKIKQITKRSQAFLVADESHIPPGSLGINFAFQAYDPQLFDGFILGEYLGGGLTPMCAGGVTENVFQQAGTLHSSMSSLYPLGPAVGLESLCMLEEMFLAEKALVKGAIIQNYFAQRKFIKEVYSHGLIFKIILSDECDINTIAAQLKDQLLLCHIFNDKMLMITPALIISEQEIEILLQKLGNIFPLEAVKELSSS
jgi:ornithine--oxo-acid transaminase